MKSIQSISVTGDFLRMTVSGGSSQNGNIRWLYNLVRPALELLTSVRVAPVYFAGDPSCIANRIFGANLMQPTFDSWVRLYDKEPGARDLALLDDRFGDSLVVGFELPEMVRKAFELLAINYVDFTIHPARFLDDLLFGVRSNVPGLGRVLRPWIVYEEEIHVAAGLAMATLSKMPQVAACTGLANVGLFAGQTADDKVLIRDGKLMKADVFMDEFAALCGRHERILVKPHPYATSNPVILALTRLLPNTQLIDHNFYHLMAQDAITHVYSLTSSTSIEAAYFGKVGRHLAPYPYVFDDSNGINGHFLTIRPDLYLPDFWAAIMELLPIPARKVRSVPFARDRSRMRRSLRNFWGADVFEFVG